MGGGLQYYRNNDPVFRSIIIWITSITSQSDPVQPRRDVLSLNPVLGRPHNPQHYHNWLFRRSGDGFWWIKHDGNILRPLPSHLETSTFESFRAVKGWMEKSAELFHNCEISRRWIIIRNSSSPPSPPERMRIWKWLKWGLQRLIRNWHFRRTNSETIELSRSNIFLLHAREIQSAIYNIVRSSSSHVFFRPKEV